MQPSLRHTPPIAFFSKGLFQTIYRCFSAALYPAVRHNNPQYRIPLLLFLVVPVNTGCCQPEIRLTDITKTDISTYLFWPDKLRQWADNLKNSSNPVRLL